MALLVILLVHYVSYRIPYLLFSMSYLRFSINFIGFISPSSLIPKSKVFTSSSSYLYLSSIYDLFFLNVWIRRSIDFVVFSFYLLAKATSSSLMLFMLPSTYYFSVLSSFIILLIEDVIWPSWRHYSAASTVLNPFWHD